MTVQAAGQDRDGRDHSFDAAFPTLHGKAYRVAFQLLGSRADAEDVAQEALIRAYVRWNAFDSRGAGAWVASVAGNLAIDKHRRRARRRQAPQPEASTDGATHAVERLALRSVLARLPKRQREVIVLRYLADMSEEDVAKALGVSVNSVKTHASRGFTRLRSTLGGDLATEVTNVSAPG